MEDKVTRYAEEYINKLIEQELTSENLEYLYKLIDIYKDAKEVESMYGNYGNYNGRGPGHGSYGRGYSEGYGEYGRDSYNNYGRRGQDARYRGHEYMDRMYGEYGRYEEGRRSYNEGNYGAKDDTIKSLKYMLESMVDFVEMLKSEANSQEEMELIRHYTQKISEM